MILIYLWVEGTITVPETRTSANPNTRKNLTIKNYAAFTECISEINNTQIDNTKDIYILMLMYNLIEYNDNSLKTSANLWQHYRDEIFLNDHSDVADFSADNDNSALFKFKIKIAGRTENDGTKNVKIMAPLKYLSNF